MKVHKNLRLCMFVCSIIRHKVSGRRKISQILYNICMYVTYIYSTNCKSAINLDPIDFQTKDFQKAGYGASICLRGIYYCRYF